MAWNWAEKLGDQQPPPPPPVRSPYGTGVLPRGMGSDQARVINDYMARRLPPPQTVVQQQVQQEQWTPKPSDQADKVGEVLPIWQWQGNARGAAGEEAEMGGGCPNCGSPRYFSRRNGGTTVTTQRGVFYPAPECTDCGYPKEQGILAGAGISSTGPAKAAKSGPAPPPPAGSMAFIKR
jgi:hypothetical protein